jgi:DUF4097 and DUF4098 domain-containing protein YvlB
MNRFLIALIGAILAVPVLPAPAGAQVYPERIIAREKARAVTAAAYQRRSRDNDREEQVERTTKTLKLGANGILSLSNIAGDIAIARGGGSETTVEIVKTARGRDVDDAREQLQLVTVEVSERPGRADVRTHYPRQAGRDDRRSINVSVAYTVTTPADTRVTVNSISGSVKVTDIKGDVTASTVSGTVRVSGTGRTSAKSSSGMVEIIDAQMDGTLESSSVSGDVVLRRVSARRVDAGSVSGGIKLEEVQCDRVSAKTTSGSVSYAGTLARNGRYELGSFSGDVRLTLAGNSGFEIDATSFSGDIRSDFAITTRGPQTTRRGRTTALNGTFGDGSAILDLTTFSGSIVISKR